jgi:hypothetical protein
MSQTSRAIAGASAIALTLGAVPLAAGRDLSSDAFQHFQNAFTTSATPTNHAAKADRAPALAQPGAPTRTIALQFNSLPATSVLVRIPVAQAARSGVPAPSLLRSGPGKPPVACEPSVSVLTEIAKRLAPGRCVT